MNAMNFATVPHSGRLAGTARRVRGITPLAIALAPHLLRITPDEFQMLITGFQATVHSVAHAWEYTFQRMTKR
jgi:hypothetical protein